ncbi:MAG: hypothetical protein WCP96_02205 [Methylococcaceae bacterium]
MGCSCSGLLALHAAIQMFEEELGEPGGQSEDKDNADKVAAVDE